ncbi:DUF2530 domain-containing protein [Pseudonocardia sp. CA-107938]|uniref:DUF2530 domain-containing protein n=1 Tax=Pseudonocardia sp. CA-107938 TaxID=3240021 RepID=UPI003D8F8D33
MVDPPPLPARLTRITDAVAVGSALWALAAAALFVASLTGGRPLDIWFVTCLVGTALGGLGYGIFRWQRAAARRGSRTAQQGLENA